MALHNTEKPLAVVQSHCGRWIEKRGRNWNEDWLLGKENRALSVFFCNKDTPLKMISMVNIYAKMKMFVKQRVMQFFKMKLRGIVS